MNSISTLIRKGYDDFTTPNFLGLENNSLLVELKNFRDQKHCEEFILFIEYGQKLYYPAWQEFRGLNNHLLYLIQNLGLKDFEELAKLLESSFEKEERKLVKIKSMLIRVTDTLSRQDIRWLIPLPGFDLQDPNAVVELSSSNGVNL